MQPFAGRKIDKVAGIEARGFILGGAVAHQLSAGFVPLRKKGKLPHQTIAVDYALEYGIDTIEMHLDAFLPGEKVMLVDDLIATGGTAIAAVELLRQGGADVIGAAFVVDLPDTGRRAGSRAAGDAGGRVPWGPRPWVSFAGGGGPLGQGRAPPRHGASQLGNRTKIRGRAFGR